mmetsp:Transcript_44694/g.118293  ORF Transcript_44694/g.118293 Transcript_44694/m.118293 type:complete len:269 (+) Transcript_44694:1278-2084(+)
MLRRAASILKFNCAIAASPASLQRKHAAATSAAKASRDLPPTLRRISNSSSSSPLVSGWPGNCSSKTSMRRWASSLALLSSSCLKISACSCKSFSILCSAMAMAPVALSVRFVPHAPWTLKSWAAILVSKWVKAADLTGSNIVAKVPGSTYPAISGIFSLHASTAAARIASTAASVPSWRHEFARSRSCHMSQQRSLRAFFASSTTSAQYGKPSFCWAASTAWQNAASSSADLSFSHCVNSWSSQQRSPTGREEAKSSDNCATKASHR